MQAKANAHTHC